MKSFPPYFMGEGHYALAPLENLVGMHPLIIARKCRINLAKILNLAKRIVRKNRSVNALYKNWNVLSYDPSWYSVEIYNFLNNNKTTVINIRSFSLFP